MVDPIRYRAGTLTYTKRTLGVLFFWLLWGDFCYVLMDNVVPSILPLKFKELGAPNAVVGLILATIPNVIASVCNPVISFKSDRFRSRWGRRIPFILFALPFIVACLLGVGFGDRIGLWLHGRLGPRIGHLSPKVVSLVTIGAMMVGYAFFSTLGNAVFWYLFNDVVPEHLLARFMSWLRLVSLVSVSIYNFFVFRYAGTHATAILVGAAALYFAGFGLMCLNVKEGRYPPPPRIEGGGSGVVAGIRTYGRECHSLSHYWYVFAVAIGVGGLAGAGSFMLFFYQATGLTLGMIGTVMGVGNIATSMMILVSAWLADRYHPIRVVIAGLVFQVAIATPACLTWLFWHPSPQVSYYLWLAVTVGLTAPAAAMWGVLDPPLFMRIFPRDRYGQFCSCNAMWRSGSVIVSAVMVGTYLDVLKGRRGSRFAYSCLPLWQLGSYAVMLVFTIKLYRSWKRYGGDEAYIPPLPPGVAPLAADEAVAILMA